MFSIISGYFLSLEVILFELRISLYVPPGKYVAISSFAILLIDTYSFYNIDTGIYKIQCKQNIMNHDE